MRFLAVIWLSVVIFFTGYLTIRAYNGIHFRTDLMALLPREEQNLTLQHANDAVTTALSKRIIIMVGSPDHSQAHHATSQIMKQLVKSPYLEIVTTEYDQNKFAKMGELYFQHRLGLLSANDRLLLKENKAQDIATRALSQAYGLIGISDIKLIKNDPFLLLPHFLTNFPTPLSHLSINNGIFSLQNNGTTWTMIIAHLKKTPFAQDVQDNVINHYNAAVKSQLSQYPNLKILHSGAIFFAEAATKTALSETSLLGIISLLGTSFLLIVFFRAISPLYLSLLTVIVGIIMALSICLWIFGELHGSTLLFGTSLIGITVDYSLEYYSQIFSPSCGTAHDRLKKVFPAITLGMITTIIGYAIFYLTPFPGLQQVAFFSTIGIISAWLTLILWLPRLDYIKSPPHSHMMVMFSAYCINLWKKPYFHYIRYFLLISISLLGLFGLSQTRNDDDVRHLQSLSEDLKKEQLEIEKLIGYTGNNTFFLIQAKDEETALQQEEKLAEKLHILVNNKTLEGFQGVSNYVPSIKRQKENEKLVYEKLYRPLFTKHISQLHLPISFPIFFQNSKMLSLEDMRKLPIPPPFLSTFIIKNTDNQVIHIVTLNGIKHIDTLAKETKNINGVRFVNPVKDFSTLIGKYRHHAYFLLILSVIIMMPLLFWRYGFYKTFIVIIPPLLAVLLTPGIRTLMGGDFTFFDVMALILVLSIGVDYSIFCAETVTHHRPITLLSITHSACSTLLSFGLLAFSSVNAIKSFGLTMFIGIILAFFLSPIAYITPFQESKK